MKKLIRANNKGQLFYNIHANEFCIEYGNLQFSLPMEEYLEFERKLKEISSDASLYNSHDKIKIPISHSGFAFLLSPEELLGLRDLFGFKSNKQVSFKLKINYSMN